MGSKIIGVKNNFEPKKIVEPKILWAQNNCDQNNLVPKLILGPKIIMGPKINMGPTKFCVQKKFWGKKNCGSKKILCPRKFWVKKNF